MEIVTTHKAKTELSKLLARAEAGEEIIIARGDKPIAFLGPISALSKRDRKPGSWKGKFTVPDSAFEPLPDDELTAWEGGR
jgi:antitoxin (DNA-binding transcriptional repressor) of toxin-antitoxin stability system